MDSIADRLLMTICFFDGVFNCYFRTSNLRNLKGAIILVFHELFEQESL